MKTARKIMLSQGIAPNQMFVAVLGRPFYLVPMLDRLDALNALENPTEADRESIEQISMELKKEEKGLKGVTQAAQACRYQHIPGRNVRQFPALGKPVKHGPECPPYRHIRDVNASKDVAEINGCVVEGASFKGEIPFRTVSVLERKRALAIKRRRLATEGLNYYW